MIQKQCTRESKVIMRMQRFYPRNMADYFSKSTVLAFFYVDFYLKPGPPVGFDFPEDME